jgi:hypothetical protein
MGPQSPDVPVAGRVDRPSGGGLEAGDPDLKEGVRPGRLAASGDQAHRLRLGDDGLCRVAYLVGGPPGYFRAVLAQGQHPQPEQLPITPRFVLVHPRVVTVRLVVPGRVT